VTGIVIKYENMEYKRAVHQAHLVLDLCAKSKRYIRELFEPPDVSTIISPLVASVPTMLLLAVYDERNDTTEDNAKISLAH